MGDNDKKKKYIVSEASFITHSSSISTSGDSSSSCRSSSFGDCDDGVTSDDDDNDDDDVEQESSSDDDEYPFVQQQSQHLLFKSRTMSMKSIAKYSTTNNSSNIFTKEYSQTSSDDLNALSLCRCIIQLMADCHVIDINDLIQEMLNQQHCYDSELNNNNGHEHRNNDNSRTDTDSNQNRSMSLQQYYVKQLGYALLQSTNRKIREIIFDMNLFLSCCCLCCHSDDNENNYEEQTMKNVIPYNVIDDIIDPYCHYLIKNKSIRNITFQNGRYYFDSKNSYNSQQQHMNHKYIDTITSKMHKEYEFKCIIMEYIYKKLFHSISKRKQKSIRILKIHLQDTDISVKCINELINLTNHSSNHQQQHLLMNLSIKSCQFITASSSSSHQLCSSIKANNNYHDNDDDDEEEEYDDNNSEAEEGKQLFTTKTCFNNNNKNNNINTINKSIQHLALHYIEEDDMNEIVIQLRSFHRLKSLTLGSAVHHHDTSSSSSSSSFITGYDHDHNSNVNEKMICYIPTIRWISSICNILLPSCYHHLQSLHFHSIRFDERIISSLSTTIVTLNRTIQKLSFQYCRFVTTSSNHSIHYNHDNNNNNSDNNTLTPITMLQSYFCRMFTTERYNNFCYDCIQNNNNCCCEWKKKRNLKSIPMELIVKQSCYYTNGNPILNSLPMILKSSTCTLTSLHISMIRVNDFQVLMDSLVNNNKSLQKLIIEHNNIQYERSDSDIVRYSILCETIPKLKHLKEIKIGFGLIIGNNTLDNMRKSIIYSLKQNRSLYKIRINCLDISGSTLFIKRTHEMNLFQLYQYRNQCLPNLLEDIKLMAIGGKKYVQHHGSNDSPNDSEDDNSSSDQTNDDSCNDSQDNSNNSNCDDDGDDDDDQQLHNGINSSNTFIRMMSREKEQMTFKLIPQILKFNVEWGDDGLNDVYRTLISIVHLIGIEV